MCTPAGLRRSRRVVPGERRRRSSTGRLSGSHEVDRVLQGPRDSIAPNPIPRPASHYGRGHDRTAHVLDGTLISSRATGIRHACESYAGMATTGTGSQVPTVVSATSGNLKGLQRSGKRNTLSGTPEEGIASQPWPANKPLERTGVNARADIVGASAGRSAPSHPLGRDSCRDPAAALLSSRSLSGR